MRYSSDWRSRHNERINEYFFPSFIYPPSEYPAIVPYCALPNYWSVMNYEIEDLIDKKFKTEINKMLLMREGLYPKKLLGGGNSMYTNYVDGSLNADDYINNYQKCFKNYTPDVDPLLLKLKALDYYYKDSDELIRKRLEEERKRAEELEELRKLNEKQTYIINDIEDLNKGIVDEQIINNKIKKIENVDNYKEETLRRNQNIWGYYSNYVKDKFGNNENNENNIVNALDSNFEIKENNDKVQATGSAMKKTLFDNNKFNPYLQRESNTVKFVGNSVLSSYSNDSYKKKVSNEFANNKDKLPNFKNNFYSMNNNNGIQTNKIPNNIKNSSVRFDGYFGEQFNFKK